MKHTNFFYQCFYEVAWLLFQHWVTYYYSMYHSYTLFCKHVRMFSNVSTIRMRDPKDMDVVYVAFWLTDLYHLCLLETLTLIEIMGLWRIIFPVEISKGKRNNSTFLRVFSITCMHRQRPRIWLKLITNLICAIRQVSMYIDDPHTTCLWWTILVINIKGPFQHSNNEECIQGL